MYVVYKLKVHVHMYLIGSHEILVIHVVPGGGVFFPVSYGFYLLVNSISFQFFLQEYILEEGNCLVY